MLGIRAGLALLVLACVEAKIGITKGRAVVTSGTGSEEVFSIKDNVLPEPITLPEASTFKLTFNVDGELPQQAFIVFTDKERDEDVTLQLGVKDNGRATFFIDTARPNPGLASTSGKLKASLLLSRGADGFRTTLGDITLPSSSLTAPKRKRHDLPPRSGEPAFAPQPEITHTFQPDAKTIGAPKAIIGSLAVVAPWLTLLGLIAGVYPSLQVRASNTAMYAWFACLVALEALILSYWIGLKLYQLLPAFIGLSAVTAYVGAVALRGAREVRLREGGKP